ncbi:thioesterase superfamily protein [Rippkaea orientalis PCC 8801]|uniref:1,4-dihydroxy-2-naphthoyl-CoA hydrolase n=1 Tax=Rippkaea orientalis (strain PCC 8801 / RF-1) TaxID=41431 RepID=DNCH_RIPO1|nr:thioesterase family protein [Rippkaea orientalis]B7JXS8.1 RecName: Full=1,4-dihydroxy-2-naphthoyl-CoA hydrolase; Short=DHNA-CoA hydrolase; AltName: Full=DHNA-CoA thioesterase [Rippkaea orientalis PCC 8801]ACK65892.1 thioesterase superfamily protein [Rippkaea orientalis PCC 8801]
MNDYTRTIRLSDTDAAGVVYFASLLSICHEAYEASLEASGIDLKSFFRDSEVVIPIVHAEIDFFRPLYSGDRIIITLTTLQLKDTEFEITYQVGLVAPQSSLIAKAKTRHVAINPQTRQRTPLSESLMQWLKSTENSE